MFSTYQHEQPQHNNTVRPQAAGRGGGPEKKNKTLPILTDWQGRR